MSLVPVRQTSFSFGELSPTFHGRSELDQYKSGLATCRNFVPLPHGALEYRHGFEYCGMVRGVTNLQTRLVSFRFSNSDSVVLEFGNLYLRFWVNGALIAATGAPAWVSGGSYVVGDVVSSGGVGYICILATTGTTALASDTTHWSATTEYSLVTTYATAHLFDLKFAQSGDVVFITHKSYAPRALTRSAAAQWTLADIAFGSPAAPATSPIFVGTPANTDATNTHPPKSWTWVYTLLGTGTQKAVQGPVGESLPSNVLTPAGSGLVVLYSDQTPVTVNVGNSGKLKNVYRGRNGTYGWIGQTSLQNFEDQGDSPQWGWNPPDGTNPFNAANNYPAAVAFFDDRLCFGGTVARPQTMWGSQVGDYFRFDKTWPKTEQAAFEWLTASRELAEIRSIASAKALVALTSAGVFAIDGGQDPLSALSVRVRRQSSVSASSRDALVLGAQVLFEQDGGGAVFTVGYSQDNDGLADQDVSVLARHLLEGYTVKDWCVTHRPHTTIWIVRSDGVLLSLTYNPELRVIGWARHDVADGVETTVESVAAVTESGEDCVYAVIYYYSDSLTPGEDAIVSVQRMRLGKRAWPEEEARVDCAVVVDLRDALTNPHMLEFAEGTKTNGLTVGLTGTVSCEFLGVPGALEFDAGDVGSTLIVYLMDPTLNTHDRTGGILFKASVDSFDVVHDTIGITITELGAQTDLNEIEWGTYSGDPDFFYFKQYALPESSTISLNDYGLVGLLFGAPTGAREAAYALVDGVPVGPLSMPSITVDLGTPPGYVAFGYRIHGEIETLDFAPQEARLRNKAVAQAAVEVEASRGVYVGSDANNMVEASPAGDGLVTELITAIVPGGYDYKGRVLVQATAPTPCTLLAVTREIDVGG